MLLQEAVAVGLSWECLIKATTVSTAAPRSCLPSRLFSTLHAIRSRPTAYVTSGVKSAVA